MIGKASRIYDLNTKWQKVIGDINRFYAGHELSEDFLHEASGFYPPRKPLDVTSNRMKTILSTLNMYKAMTETNKRLMENQLKEAKLALYILDKYPDDFLMKLKAYANELRESELDGKHITKRKASEKRLGEFEDWKRKETEENLAEYEYYLRNSHE